MTKTLMNIDYSVHYSRWHSDSDEHYAYSAIFHRSLLAPVLSTIDPKAKIVDIGCGAGLLVNALKVAGFECVTGIDVSPQLIELARRRGLPCDVVDESYLVEWARSEPRSCDVIFLMDVLEHVPVEKQMEMLTAIWCLLKPGGRVVMSVPNANSTFAMRWRYIDWTHHSSFTECSLEFVLQSCGYQKICFLPFEFGLVPRFPYIHRLAFWTWLLRKTVRLLRRMEAIGELGREGLKIPLGLNLLAVAQKSR